MPQAYPKFEETTVAAVFAATAIAHADRVAVEDEASSLTYRELSAAVGRIARRIEQSAAPGAPVGILLPLAVPSIAAVFAILATGRSYLAMDPAFPAPRLRLMVEHAGLAAIIVDRDTAAAMHEIAPDLPQISISETEASENSALPVSASPDDVACIFFTSGSTSRPKAVFQSQRNLVYEARYHVAALDIVPDDRIALTFSASAAGSMRNIFGALLTGACLSIVDVRRLGLQRARQLIGTQRLTMWHSVPALFRTVFADAAQDAGMSWDSLRIVYLAADRIFPSDVALFGRRFANRSRLFLQIGATETHDFAFWFVDPEAHANDALVPVGFPRADKLVTLIDDAGNPVAPGTIGEIMVTGRSLSRGYWRDEALTRERFVPSTAMPGGTDYRTGDLGRFTRDGLLEYIGRKDRRVKIRGNTVHLGEIEAVLAGCPGLVEVAVVGRVEETDTVLIAYCAGASGEIIDEETLRRRCRDHLPAPMRPTRFVVMPALPKMANGKIDLVGLAALDHRAAPSHAAPPGHHAAAANLASIVRSVWENFLSGDSFEADAPFDAAGGNSLMGLEIVVLLEEKLGRRLPVGTLDLETRPSDLIERLGRPDGNVAAPGDQRPFMALFLGMWGGDVSTSDFVRRIAANFRVWGVDYRLGGDDLAGTFDSERYFAAILEEIRRMGPPERLWLVGYSYGGRLAAEMACRLLAAGIAVEVVASLDGRAGRGRWPLNPALSQPRRGLMTRLRSGTARSGGLLRYLVETVAIRLVGFSARRGDYRVLRPVIALVARFGSADIRYRAMRLAVQSIRLRAFGDLPVSPLPMDVWLFTTDDPWHDRARPDMGWEGRCRSVNVISVGGMHQTMLTPPGSTTLIGKLSTLEVSLRLQRQANETASADRSATAPSNR